MRFPARVFIGLAWLSLAACATPYKPYNRIDGGFTETEVQPGLFLVRFVGNDATTPDRSTDFALPRAADICLQRGKGFMRVGGLATQNVQSGYIAGATSSTVIPSGSPDVPPVVSVSIMPPTLLYSPQSALTVSCADSAQDGAWDANYLARAIRTKYSMM